MKTKIVNGVRYIAQDIPFMYNPETSKRVQYCSGCIAIRDNNLCESLQECFDQAIIWVVDDIMDEIVIDKP